MSRIVTLREKIDSISRINKMTEAMQVVSVAQLKTVQSRQRAAWHYKKHYDRLVKRLGISVEKKVQNSRSTVLVYIIGSERGFCGSYNENLLSKLRNWRSDWSQVELRVVGRKAREVVKEHHLSSGFSREVNIGSGRDFNESAKIAQEAFDLFRTGQVAEVYLVYNRFESILKQIPMVRRVLPFDLSFIEVEQTPVVYEPSEEQVNKYLALNYVKVLFYNALLQSSLGEVAARLMTMRGATENSKEMISNLKIKLNKARQAMITVELAEIVSSFEILAEGE